ncbi:MAG: hypothetical protein PUF65_08715 [Lachnospiraceae bacterium]|nr:hypothetical protein [Lachnospiraceae bacterium]
MGKKAQGQVLIECPNTVFYLYVSDERDLSKIATFTRNLKKIREIGLNDIYMWCNRQGIAYRTRFHYRKEFSLLENMIAYIRYSQQKIKYQVLIGMA